MDDFYGVLCVDRKFTTQIPYLYVMGVASVSPNKETGRNGFNILVLALSLIIIHDILSC